MIELLFIELVKIDGAFKDVEGNDFNLSIFPNDKINLTASF